MLCGSALEHRITTCTLNSAIILLGAAFLPQRKTGPVFGPIEPGGERSYRWKNTRKSAGTWVPLPEVPGP